MRKSKVANIENGKPLIPAKFSTSLRLRHGMKQVEISAVCQEKYALLWNAALHDAVANPC